MKLWNGTAWLEITPSPGNVANEVAIQTDDPIGVSPEVELWYDTDDPGLGDLSRLPRGYIGSARASASDQTGISSAGAADVTGMTVTFTADPTRRYLITANIVLAAVTQECVGVFDIANASNAALCEVQITIPSGKGASLFGHAIISGISGSYTAKGRIFNSVAGGTITVINSGGRNGLLLVQDIGAV